MLASSQCESEGLEQGRQETRHLPARFAHHRFSSVIDAQAEPLQAAIASPQQLKEFGELLLACSDVAEWLQALHSIRRNRIPAPTNDSWPPRRECTD